MKIIPFTVTVLPILLIYTTAFAQTPDPTPNTATDKKVDPINPDRPGIADGSNVIGSYRFQIEIGFQEEHRKADSEHDRLRYLPTLLRYGFDNHWEFRFETANYGHNYVTDNGTHRNDYGFAPFSFGFKWHYADSLGVRRPSQGIIGRLFPASGTGNFRSRRTDGDLRWAADWDFAPNLSLNPNLGVGFYEGNEHSYTALLGALTLTYTLSSKLGVFIDGGAQSPEGIASRKTATTADIGLTYLPTNNMQLDASVGNGIGGATPPHPFIGLGISYRW